MSNYTSRPRPASRLAMDAHVTEWARSLGATVIRAEGNPRGDSAVSVYVEVASLDDRAIVANACRAASADSVREHDADEDGPAYVGAVFSVASLGRVLARFSAA